MHIPEVKFSVFSPKFPEPPPATGLGWYIFSFITLLTQTEHFPDDYANFLFMFFNIMHQYEVMNQNG